MAGRFRDDGKLSSLELLKCTIEIVLIGWSFTPYISGTNVESIIDIDLMTCTWDLTESKVTSTKVHIVNMLRISGLI